jgi:hypothetical protein
VSRISSGRETLDEVASAPGAATAEVKQRILRHRDGDSARTLMEHEERALHIALFGDSGTAERAAPD